LIAVGRGWSIAVASGLSTDVDARSAHGGRRRRANYDARADVIDDLTPPEQRPRAHDLLSRDPGRYALGYVFGGFVETSGVGAAFYSQAVRGSRSR
jgi:hypothetical protein